jgi:putative oxidoreductase
MKSLFFGTHPENNVISEVASLSLRVFAGLAMAFAHGLGKVPPSEPFIGALSSMGVPAAGVFAWAAGLSELGGGILLALGLFTRPAALTLTLTMAVAAFVAHGSDPFGKKELALLYFFIYLFFTLKGASRFSLDHLISGKKN